MRTLIALTLSTLLFLSSGCETGNELESCEFELGQLNDTILKSQLETAMQIDKYKQQIADVKEKSIKQVQALKISLTDKVQQAQKLMQQATAKAEEYKTTLRQKAEGFLEAQTKLEKMDVEMEALKKKLLETLAENGQLKKKIEQLEADLQAATASQPPTLPEAPEIE
jgi:chromosome segregation ATPase